MITVDVRLQGTPETMHMGVSTMLQPPPALPARCTIKAVAAEFAVREVDKDGVAVPSTAESEYAHPGGAPVAAPPRATLDVAVRPLGELLPADVCAAVAAAGAHTLGSSGVALGVIVDKARRGTVRCSVRHAFPRLAVDLERKTAMLTARVDDVAYPRFEACLGHEGADTLMRFCVRTGLPATAPDETVVVAMLPGATRELRAALQQELQRTYPYLRATPLDNRVVSYRRAESQDGARKRQRSDGVATGYTHIVAAKRNVSAMDMRRHLAAYFRVAATDVATAGSKDKRADTWQRVSVPGDHTALVRTDFDGTVWKAPRGGDGYVRVTHAQLRSVPLHSGSLRGNQFDLIVRAPDDAPVGWATAVAARADGVASHGFANYFGPQRFGYATDAASHVGVLALRGDMAGVVMALAVELPGETVEAVAAAKAHYRETSDAAAALRIAGAASSDFTDAMRHVVACRGDHAAALRRLDYDVRQMWLHAAQSLVFNLVCAARLAAESTAAREADWITPDSAGGPSRDHAVVAAGQAAPLSDVVAPLIGSHTRLNDSPAPGSLDALVATALQSLQLKRSDFDGAPMGVTLKGTVRRIVAVPLSLTVTETAATAIRVRMELPSSCYATVLLRELTGVFPDSA
jgi:TruD family tRNA pseudouridine synthase